MIVFLIYLTYLAVIAYFIMLSNVWLYFEERQWPEWKWQIKIFTVMACVGIAFLPIVFLLNFLRP